MIEIRLCCRDGEVRSSIRNRVCEQLLRVGAVLLVDLEVGALLPPRMLLLQHNQCCRLRITVW